MEPDLFAKEVCTVNTSQLVWLVRANHGQAGISQLLERLGSISEDYLRATENWISLEALFRLFDNLHTIYSNPSPQLFFNLGMDVQATQGGALVTIVKWVGTPEAVIRSSPSYNRRFNEDQEIEVVELGRGHALIANFFRPDYFERERLDQCYWTRGILAGAPSIFGQKPAKVREIACSFRLEEILKRDYAYLDLSVEEKDGRIYINSEEYAHRVALAFRECNPLFLSARDTPQGIEKGTRQVLSGGYQEIGESDEFVGYVVTKTLNIDGEAIIKEGEIYNAPYCLYELTWEPVSIWRRLYQKTIGRIPLFFGRIRELEDLLDKYEGLVDTLERKVQERTAELETEKLRTEAALHNLEQATQRLIQLETEITLRGYAAAHRHEWNTHLMILRAFAEILSDISDYFSRLYLSGADMCGFISREQLEQLANAREAAMRYGQAAAEYATMTGTPIHKRLAQCVKSIIGELDTLSQLSEELKTDSDPSRVHLIPERIEKTIELALYTYTEAMKQQGVPEITTEIDYPPNLPMVLYNRPKIYQALLLHLRNAYQSILKRMQESGYSDDKPRISVHICCDIGSQSEEQRVYITISDNGTGIADEDLSKIFERFYSTTDMGTGIGLALAKEIIEVTHKGLIYARSRLGKGSEFIWELPVYHNPVYQEVE
ncbi:hypothetical protein JW930_02530 [Candidatus Woesearchaeota archaeon]|nr:hypothetical protein [Candidatus Woesearchaeota archaeon]